MNEQEKFDWMVYVSCMTFNQASYIEDAMNGFTMQKTDFPFVCAIVDDASTDGEQEVIKNYLNEHFDLEDKNIVRHEETDDFILTYARNKTNMTCYFAVLYLKYNHYKKKPKLPYLARWRDNAKYMAICEGDDYWIDSHKLQRQTDLFRNNPEMTYCFSNRKVHNEITGRDRIDRYSNRKYTQKDFLSGFNPGLQTVMLEIELIKNVDYALYKGVNGDRLYPYLCTREGYALCLQEETAVYRFSPIGVSSSVALRSTPSAYFKHACDDFYRFHESTGYPYKKGYMKASANYAIRYLVQHKDFNLSLFYEMTSRYNGHQSCAQFIGTMRILITTIIRKSLKRIVERLFPATIKYKNC